MFKQEAFGRFSVHVTGPNHCGPNHDSPKTFQYEVEIHAPFTALDERGFLLDNLSFEVWFARLGSISESCEQLVMRSACAFWDAAQGRCLRVRVAIWGFHEGHRGAKVEAHVDADSLEEVRLYGAAK